MEHTFRNARLPDGRRVDIIVSAGLIADVRPHDVAIDAHPLHERPGETDLMGWLVLPAMAERAKHVTMLQRSPTYMGSKPAEDPVGNWLGKWLGHWAARWWFILTSMFLYAYCKAFPARAKKAIISEIETLLGDQFDPKHFTPNYDPWDQRVCLCPDADFFEAMKSGKASIATDHIERFTSDGILLKSGDHLAADMIVTATGLDMLFLGGMEVVVDGQVADPAKGLSQ